MPCIAQGACLLAKAQYELNGTKTHFDLSPSYLRLSQAEREMKSSGKSASHRPVSKVPPKSLHHIDDEEYQAKLEAAWQKAKDEEKKENAPALKEEKEVVNTPDTAEEAEVKADEAPILKEDEAPILKEDEAPILKEDERVKYEKKVTPTSGPKYNKTGKNYKK